MAVSSDLHSKAIREAAPGGRKDASQVSQGSNSDSNGAFKKIVALVNMQDRSERTIRERLAKADYDAAEIDEAVERAKSYGIIDDKRFADVLIRSRLAQGKGSAGIERELASHDIEVFNIEGWPYEYGIGDESEEERAFELLKKNPSRSKNKREGAYRKLVQKGYSSSVASSVARRWSDSTFGS